MAAPAKPADSTPGTVAFTLDQQIIDAFAGETILQAAQRHGVDLSLIHI